MSRVRRGQSPRAASGGACAVRRADPGGCVGGPTRCSWVVIIRSHMARHGTSAASAGSSTERGPSAVMAAPAVPWAGYTTTTVESSPARPAAPDDDDARGRVGGAPSTAAVRAGGATGARTAASGRGTSSAEGPAFGGTSTGMGREEGGGAGAKDDDNDDNDGVTGGGRRCSGRRAAMPACLCLSVCVCVCVCVSRG
jgi:hypothetical protein